MELLWRLNSELNKLLEMSMKECMYVLCKEIYLRNYLFKSCIDNEYISYIDVIFTLLIFSQMFVFCFLVVIFAKIALKRLSIFEIMYSLSDSYKMSKMVFFANA